MKVIHISAMLAFALSAAASEASTTYNFSYIGSGGVLTGQLIGTLQADNNTIVVDSVSDFAAFNAVSGPSLPFVNSYTGWTSSVVEPGIVSINGFIMDIIACNNTGCALPAENDGFLLHDGSVLNSFFNSGLGFGGANELYSPLGWSISAAAVPEPANWAMLIAGFGLIGAAMRRRRSAAVAA